MNKEKWFIYTRGTVHPHRLFACLKGIAQYRSKLLGAPFDNVLYINQGSKLWWGWNEKEIKRIGNYLLGICGNKKTRLNHFRKFEDCLNSAIGVSKKIRKMNLTRLSDKKLIKLYDFLYDNTAFTIAMTGVVIDAIDIVFEGYLQDKIKNELPADISESELLELYKNLLISTYVSYIQKQELEILKAAGRKKIEDAGRIYKKYWWTKLGWENMEPHTCGYFKKEIKKAANKKNIDKRINQISSRAKNIKKQRNDIVKKYKFSNEIIYWLETLDQYTYFHDLRKEMQVRATYVAHLILVETARRFNLKIKDLEWLLYNEVQDILKGKLINKKEIEKRKKAVCIIVDKRGFKLWSGEEAIKRKNKELNRDNKRVAEFKGMGVSKGKAISKVKVCNGAVEAFKKIKKGDILVCGMTLPDYVPAMKLAKAIITDEGGITCHAAIISRELGIPCIVSTKIATQVLKDGDLVEVDAERGIVKIIKIKKCILI